MLSVLCSVFHVFPPRVSLFGLFPILVSCDYELILVQLCLSHYLWLPCVFIVVSVQFDFVLSTCYSPVFPGVSALPYLALFGFIKHCHLSLLLISVFLVHPCFVHQDRRPDLNRKRRPLFHHILIFFNFWKFFVLFLPVCFPTAWKLPLVIPP